MYHSANCIAGIITRHLLCLAGIPLPMLQQRMPSGMQGDKNRLEDDGATSGAGMGGSLRNHLAVWGPGVPSGGVSDMLLNLADVLPTIAELADATNTKHETWVSTHMILRSASTPCSRTQNVLAVASCSIAQQISSCENDVDVGCAARYMPACCTACALLQLPPASFAACPAAEVCSPTAAALTTCADLLVFLPASLPVCLLCR
jgi:hypothetical protein